MTPTEGVRRIRKLLGTKAKYRELHERTSPEGRALAMDKARHLKALYDAAKEKRDALHRELLADHRYQAIQAETAELRRQWERERGLALRYRLTVGTVEGGMFFMVKAQGDNWAEVVFKLESGAVKP